jgi:predicted ATPase
VSVAEVLVLGPVALADGAGPVTPPAMVKRLVAALVVADGRVCHTDELIEAFWGDDPPASARKLVRVYVSQLRKALPAGVAIETVGGGYALRLPPEALDAARFERLLDDCNTARRDGNAALAASLAEQALLLWRGRAYGELAYEEVARAESDRLEELRLVALEERLDAQLALGRHGDVLGEALALAGEHPLRERAHELAMLALYRCDRQAEALEHYTAFRARLSEELGLEPGPALRELQRRILQHDPGLGHEQDDAAVAASLPASPNPLVGRTRELDEVGALLLRRDARLIVLTGAGGSGKSRLALEAAREARRSFANGVVLVELAPLRDPELVLPTIAHAVGVADTPAETLLDVLAESLRPRELLLVLDNVEHLRPATSSFVELLARAPRLTLLVTSRAVLHVSGEHVFPVDPLGEDAAVELFEQRARALRPEFRVTAENDGVVREICRRVDRLPLAIELAAARIRTLRADALLDRLGQRLSVLTGGPRDLPARQQTLRATLEWSVRLLSDDERRVLARLAVFPAGATVEASEQVCGADLDTLTALVDHSLVRRVDTADETRFSLLETIREYAEEVLGDERAETEHALAEHLAALVERAVLRGPGSEVWLPRLDAELDNLRAAFAGERSAWKESMPISSGVCRFQPGSV